MSWTEGQTDRRTDGQADRQSWLHRTYPLGRAGPTTITTTTTTTTATTTAVAAAAPTTTIAQITVHAFFYKNGEDFSEPGYS